MSDGELSYPKNYFPFFYQNGDLVTLELWKASKSCLRFKPDFFAKCKKTVFLADYAGFTPYFPAKILNFPAKLLETGAFPGDVEG